MMRKTKLVSIGMVISSSAAMFLTAPQAFSAAKAQPITVRMMIGDFGNLADQQLLKYLVKPYEKSHPGVKIQVEFISGGQTNVDTKAILGVNSGDPANVVAVFNDLATLAQKGAIVPLDTMYKKYHIQAKEFIPASWDATLVNGVPYGFPATSNPSYGLWYNPEAMKAAGLNPSQPPKTWTQLINDSTKAVKFDKSGNLVRVGWEFSDGGVFGAESMAYAHDYTWAKQNGKWVPTPLDPHNVQILTQIKKLADAYGGYQKYMKFVASDQGWQSSGSYGAQGKSLFGLDGYWDYMGYDQYSPKYHYMASYMPTPHGLLSEQTDNNAISWSVAFPKGQDNAHLNAAWNFVIWAFDTHSAQLELTTNGSTVISQQKAWDKLAAQSLPKDHAYFASQFKYFTDPVKYISESTPNLPITSFYENQLTQAADAVLFGKKSPEQALKDVDQAVKTQLLISGNH